MTVFTGAKLPKGTLERPIRLEQYLRLLKREVYFSKRPALSEVFERLHLDVDITHEHTTEGSLWTFWATTPNQEVLLVWQGIYALNGLNLIIKKYISKYL